MNQLYVYPRLPLSSAIAQIAEIESAFGRGGVGAVSQLVEFEHPRANPVPTGGRHASSTRIRAVRESVLRQIDPWFRKGSVPRSDVAKFDRLVGATLHRELAIVPADASHDETWSFLSLLALPDLAVLRFPEMHKDRMLGTKRNVLRRAWYRHEILGDFLMAPDTHLGEDELVGMFERTALARDRRILQILARRVAGYRGPGRSDWARSLYVRVTFPSGPRLLDTLSLSELEGLVDAAIADLGSSVPD